MAMNPRSDKRRIDGYQYAYRYNVTMTEAQYAKAKMLGRGNASAGIRKAVEELWRKEHEND